MRAISPPAQGLIWESKSTRANSLTAPETATRVISGSRSAIAVASAYCSVSGSMSACA